MHVPTDGKPLPGYNQALAAYKARGRSGPAVQVASNDTGKSSSRSGSGRGFLATLFGGGADEEEESSTSFETIARATDRNVPAVAAARAQPQPKELPGVAVAEAAPAPAAQPEPDPETPEQILASLPAGSVPLPAFAIRAGDKAEDKVATLVANASGAIPAETPTAGDQQQAALSVPLPSTRPSLDQSRLAAALPAPVTQVADAAGQIRRSALTSLAETVEVTPSGRPAAAQPNADVTLAAFAQVPRMRPSGGAIEDMIAAMPSARPGKSGSDVRTDIVGAVEQKLGKGSRVNSASQRAVILASTGKVDPMEAIASEVKTTGKSAKPGPQDLKADRKPVVVPVEDVAARWALERSGRLTRAIASAKEPSLAYHAVRTSPTQVYTDGFVPVVTEPDPARFSGNAVTFLSVANFGAN